MATSRALTFGTRFLIRNKALRFQLFRFYLLIRFSLITALNMQTAIIVYWVYTLTGDVATVGLLGLCEAIPAIGFSFVSGYFVDQREKRGLIFACLIGYLLLGAYLIALSLLASSRSLHVHHLVYFIYAGVFTGGCLRAFLSPASFALLGQLLPRRLYPNGATWSSTSWQSGAVIGPLLGGLIIAGANIFTGFAAAFALVVVAFFGILRIPAQAVLKKEKEPAIQSLREGLRFVFKTQIILAALSLDMFAVFFGGATSLLPAYVHKVIDLPKGTEEIAYGWLRAAPGIGSLIMFFVLAWTPLKKSPGLKLLAAISGFGISTIIFGLSKIFAVSFIALLLCGIFDAVSVVVRSTILQLYTPDAMRGRVAAVNTMFISSSNEIGEVESGYTAKWMGTVPAVIFGGCMTVVVAVVTSMAAPRIRKLSLSPQAGSEGSA